VALNPDRPVLELVFAEAADGDRFALAADGHVVRLRAEPDPPGAGAPPLGERWRCGSDFSRWLDAAIAHERVLYDSDGEFAAQAFDPEGGEILPVIALRQAERALRADPGSAEAEHERGVALRRQGRLEDSAAAFRRATELDPPNPWPWFDLGRVAMAMGSAGGRVALEAFEAAASRLGPGPTGARAWAWAARAAALCALPERLAHCRAEALGREAGLAESLRRARDAAAAALETGEGDPEELHEAEALLEALEGPILRGRVRLPTISASSMMAPASTKRPRGR
jgi:tetratricopeptide (TPR) repeat protein